MSKIIDSLPNKSPAQRSAMRENARKMTESGDPKKQDHAEKFLEGLDQYEAQLAAKEYEWLTSLDDVGKIKAAFERLPPTETQVNLIKVVTENPGSTSGQLSAALGWKGLTWQMHFGSMAKAREVYLWPAERTTAWTDHSGQPTSFFSGLLATFDEETSGYTLKPEAQAAFVALGLIKGKAAR